MASVSDRVPQNNKDTYTTVSGLKIRYWRSANDGAPAILEKPAVVFFHGFSFSADDWRRIGTLESVAEKGYPVFAVDLPTGKSSKSDKVGYRDRLAYLPLLERILDSIGARRDARSLVIIGPSMGGDFALLYATSHRSEISGLVLISPSTSSVDEASLSALDVPILLVWGERDNVFPLDENGQTLKRELRNSRLVILKGAGHAAYLDRPDEFNEILLDFLEAVS